MQAEGRPEEVPMQEIVFKNTQNFTREDFNKAKKHLEKNKDADTMKGFKYTYSSRYPEQKSKDEKSQVEKNSPQRMTKSEEEKAVRSPAFLPVNLKSGSGNLYTPPTEDKNLGPHESEQARRPPRHLKPIPGLRLKKLPAREDDVLDENTSYLISRYR